MRTDDGVLAVTAARQRVVLAALAIRAGRVVSFENLARSIWDGQPPANARVAVRNQVCRLRRLLVPAGGRIVTCPPGYLLDASDDEVDLLAFGRLCRDGGAALRAAQWQRAWDVLGEALGCWRGVPLADIPSRVIRDEQIPALESQRLQATEWRLEAGLKLGRHSQLVPELEALASEQPLRERFGAMLMLALYRCGRQAEALAVYQNTRQVLVGELGVEPGPDIQELHQRVLAADPQLRYGAEPPGSGWPGTSPDSWASVPWLAAGPPRQLPAGIRHFVGREAELAEMTRLADDAGQTDSGVVISAIDGTAGVGKTSLAVHWAHRMAGRFPDGQLYADLRGFGPSGLPAAPESVIRDFLDALGVPPGQRPASPQAQAALYRTLVAAKRLLIVLDNARTVDQVRPLLPGPGSCMVLVTSRARLAGLAATAGAHLFTLARPDPDEARRLLESRMDGELMAAEPRAADDLIDLCARLPLALSIAAARAAARPRFPLAALVAELRDTAGRLDALDAGTAASSVRAVFSWSYQGLPAPAARMFRLLGIHPGPDISVPAAASLAGQPLPRARAVLHQLNQASLVTEHTPGRYVLHDLLRAYAAGQARDCDSEPDRKAAAVRILDHYLHTAAHATVLCCPHSWQPSLAPPMPGAEPERLANFHQAITWFGTEHQILPAAATLATELRLDSHAWQLPWVMGPFLNTRGRYQELADIQRLALAAATRLGDTAGQAASSHLLADACCGLGDYEQAMDRYMSVLAVYLRLGNRLGEARVRLSLGVLAEGQGRHADALRSARQGLRLYQVTGHKAGEAGALNAIGWYHARLGDYEQGRVYCRQALTLGTEAGDRRVAGYIWDSLGYIEHHLGNLGEATACYDRALGIVREFGVRYIEAVVLTHLGDTRQAQRDLPRAREAWRQALAIFEDLQHPGAVAVRAKLGG